MLVDYYCTVQEGQVVAHKIVVRPMMYPFSTIPSVPW